jgi:ubiquitin carboxyl-terminal hydrolase L3
MPKSWLPLEANPEVLTSYCQRLGLQSTLGFHDVLGVEEWAMDMIPQPVHAILLLFPISSASEAERESTLADGGIRAYFMKQTVGNACGTIGDPPIHKRSDAPES